MVRYTTHSVENYTGYVCLGENLEIQKEEQVSRSSRKEGGREGREREKQDNDRSFFFR